MTLIEGLRTRAEDLGDAVAITAPSRPPLGHRALFGQVTQVGAMLRSCGLQHDDTVALALPNGPEMAVAMLGVAAHATCAPLNPEFSEREFAFYLQDLAARAIVVPHDNGWPARRAAEALGVSCILVQTQEDAPAGCARWATDTVHAGAPSPMHGSGVPGIDDVALVLHTSGTTSRPKIVPLTHGNLMASAGHIAQSLALSASDRCLNVMPLFHIHGIVAALLASLHAGGSVACTPGFSAEAIGGWLQALQPTWMTAVPTVHQALLAELEAGRLRAPLGRLRLLRSSSASLAPQTMAALEHHLGVPVIEAYGMTEATHQICSNPLPPGTRKPGSVGPAAGPEVAVVGIDGCPLPAGAPGEVVIRGPNVTPGYARNPEANAEAFREGWLRTGDLGRMDGDGHLVIEGRLKEIVNRGGEKIMPREIDEALLEHPAVAQAVAFGLPHSTLGEDLAAAVVARPGALVTEAELRHHLQALLAPHKVPTRTLVVDAIPKGATGKVQRRLLADLLSARLARSDARPAGADEQALAQAFADVLGLQDIGAEDNFFALGGDSLRASQLISRIGSRMAVRLSMADIFRHPTVRELAAVLPQARARDEAERLEAALQEIEAESGGDGDRVPQLVRRDRLSALQGLT